jgi:hypothetical protein
LRCEINRDHVLVFGTLVQRGLDECADFLGGRCCRTAINARRRREVGDALAKLLRGDRAVNGPDHIGCGDWLCAPVEAAELGNLCAVEVQLPVVFQDRLQKASNAVAERTLPGVIERRWRSSTLRLGPVFTRFGKRHECLLSHPSGCSRGETFRLLK